VEFAPINHNDLLLIKGTFLDASLPYVVGNEGVGVYGVGPTVSNVKVGDRVALRFTATPWQERVLGFRTWLVPFRRSRCAAVGHAAD